MLSNDLHTGLGLVPAITPPRGTLHVAEPGRQASGPGEDSFFDGHGWVGYRTYVTLVRENAGCRNACSIRAPIDVYRTFVKLAECDRERFYAASLDAQNRVCGVELVSQGSTTSCLVHPREVYKAAILSNATGLITIHNHPSGDPTPSAEDRAITRQLVDVGRLLDMPLYDHVIIGDERYFSFAEAGLL
jgi:DNA repair protein RadC